MEVRGGTSKDATDFQSEDEPDVRERIDSLDLQFAHRNTAEATIGPIQVRANLVVIPTRGCIRARAALRRTSVLGKEEVDVNHEWPTDDPGRDLVARLRDRR